MAQNVTIAGAQYSDVPAIDLPKTGGGTARFYDPQGNKVLTPSLAAQTNVDVKTFATASVAAITKELLASLDSDFVAGNIKDGVNLFGLVGTLEAGGGGGGVLTGTLIPASTAIQTITHNLGRTPSGIVIYDTSVSSYTSDKKQGLYFAAGTTEGQAYFAYWGSALAHYYGGADITGFRKNCVIANADSQKFECAFFAMVADQALAYLVEGHEYRWFVW